LTGHLFKLSYMETLQKRVRSLILMMWVPGGPGAQWDDEVWQPGRWEDRQQLEEDGLGKPSL
jgi:hypothetical protein